MHLVRDVNETNLGLVNQSDSLRVTIAIPLQVPECDQAIRFAMARPQRRQCMSEANGKDPSSTSRLVFSLAFYFLLLSVTLSFSLLLIWHAN